MSSIIELHNVTRSFSMGENEQQVLKGINLKINKGEMVAIMGPSGSGKSTMMNIIGLLDKPSSGQYLLQGNDVSSLTDDAYAVTRNQSFGFVFQSFFLLPRLTALENVGLPLRYRNVPYADIEKRSSIFLERVGMSGHLHHKPSELSGGQQQRVAIARALVGNPSVVFGDEPTGALDTNTSQDIMDLFKSLNQEDGATVVLVTHDPHVGQQCQRIIRIQDGRILDDERA